MQMTLKEIKKSYPKLPVHPQNTFSCVEPDTERRESLKISLLREGVIQKIILISENGQLMIWDGNVRYNLLRELHRDNLLPKDFDPNIVIWDFTPDNLDLLAAGIHIHCKHLSTSQRAAYAAKHLLDRLTDEASVRRTLGRGNKLLSDKDKGSAVVVAGKMVGCSSRLISSAKAGIDKIPKTYEWIMKGQMKATDAENLANFSNKDNQAIIIELLEKGKKYTTAMQALTNKINIRNDIEDNNGQTAKMGVVVQMPGQFTAGHMENIGEPDNFLSSPAYTKLLTKKCSEHEAQGKVYLEIHEEVTQELRESFALLMAKNGKCKNLTAIRTGKKFYLIKEQPEFDKYAPLPECA